MRLAFNHEGTLLACLLTLFVCRAVFASAIVPPWQGPDEPNHFALAKLWAVPDGVRKAAQQNVERQVLESMARHRFWEPYSEPTPDPLPTSFQQIGQRLGVGTYAQPLYYGLGAAVLRVTQPTDLEAAYWHLRLLSVVLGVTTLVFGWAGTRLLFDPLTAAGSTAIAVLNPQFLLSALTVNPDALVILCGAFIWWQVARIFRQRQRALSAALLLVAAGVALLTKRSALPMAAAGIVAASVIVIAQTQGTTRKVGFVTVLAVVGSMVLLTAALLFEDPVTSLVTFWNNALINRRPPGETALAAALRIVPSSLDNVWLVAGWLRFPAPDPWLWVSRVLTVAGLAGAVGLLVQSAALRPQLALAWGFVTLQILGVYVTAFRNVVVPEGRLLFPVLAPATVLLWMGLTWILPATARRHAAPLIVGTIAALDVTGFTTVIVPAYLR